MNKFEIKWFDAEWHTVQYTSWGGVATAVRRLAAAGFKVEVYAI